MKNIGKGDMVNVTGAINPRLQDGKVLGSVWVHMGENGDEIGLWVLVKFPRVDHPIAIANTLLEPV